MWGDHTAHLLPAAILATLSVIVKPEKLHTKAEHGESAVELAKFMGLFENNVTNVNHIEIIF